MPRDFCTRVTRKIRRLGHPEKVARRYAQFFSVSFVAVCTMSGAAPGLEGRGAIGDEIRRILKRVLTLLPAVFYPDAGAGIPLPGPRAVYIVPGYSRKRR